MASAAAVATDIARSPLPDHEVDETLGQSNITIESVDNVRDGASDDEDDDISAKPKRKSGAPAGVDDDGDVEMTEEAEMDKDLFGSDSEDGGAPKQRVKNDSDLDSGIEDDLQEEQGAEEEQMADDDQLQEELTFMDAALARHPIPDPSDGELYLLKVPRFVAIEPNQFSPDTFQTPTTDHHSREAASSTFSAYNTALTTVRWRKSPSNPDQLESNARVLRWSDGSLTLQFASDPMTQYQMPGNSLAPPQYNPAKPTPTSVSDKKKGPKAVRSTKYNADQDSFTYLCAPYQGAQVLRITNKFTAGLKIQPSVNATDEALERLQQSLAAAARGTNTMQNTEGNIGLITITEDPELQKKKAELAEKEMIRAQKRREAQANRERERTGRAFGRKGAGGGLTVGGLEDDDELGAGIGAGRRTGMASKRAKPRTARRGEILTDEEEDYERRGNNREDEYDEEDDFVAPSDEEEEVVEDDEDEDEGIELESSKKTDAPRKGRPSSPKRSRGDDDSGDAKADVPRAEGSPHARSKRRRVIDDEDEDDDE